MSEDSSRLIVTRNENGTTVFVYHRDFAEIRAEGKTAREAAGHLVNKLSLALDTALTDWRRSGVDRALADVKAYLEREESAER